MLNLMFVVLVGIIITISTFYLAIATYGALSLNYIPNILMADLVAIIVVLIFCRKRKIPK